MDVGSVRTAVAVSVVGDSRYPSTVDSDSPRAYVELGAMSRGSITRNAAGAGELRRSGYQKHDSAPRSVPVATISASSCITSARFIGPRPFEHTGEAGR